ncbi:hypothetical protein AHAS_Ahas16G0176100 [Arachis hypogaea]
METLALPPSQAARSEPLPLSVAVRSFSPFVCPSVFSKENPCSFSQFHQLQVPNFSLELDYRRLL